MLLTDQVVVVRGDRISFIGPASEMPNLESLQIVNARGKVLMPGLADMHAHLQREEDLAVYLARGVTLVRNMWGTPIHLDWRARVEDGTLVGPHVVTAGPILDGEDVVHDGSFVVRSPADAARAIAVQKALGYDFVKVYSRLSPAAHAHIVESAHESGLRVAGHVPRSVGLDGVFAAKQDVVEHFGGFVDALQKEGSDLRGRFDRASMSKKIDHVSGASRASYSPVAFSTRPRFEHC